MSVTCDVTTCNHNNGFGSCDLVDIYISDADTGDPICQYVAFDALDAIQEG